MVCTGKRQQPMCGGNARSPFLSRSRLDTIYWRHDKVHAFEPDVENEDVEYDIQLAGFGKRYTSGGMQKLTDVHTDATPMVQ